MEHQLYNLEKIKEITTPIEILQGNLNKLENIYKDFIENKNNAIKNFSDKNYISQIQELNQIWLHYELSNDTFLEE